MNSQQQESLTELRVAEQEYEVALVQFEDAQKQVFEARTNCFIYNVFDPNSVADKNQLRKLLMELADEQSPYAKYARDHGAVRTVIDSVVKFFNLENKSEEQYVSVFKLIVADEDNNTAYVVTMTYKTGEASIVAKPIDC